ncbi:uncharacterized protein LOC135964229 [Calliphora vicina]|uniref:uncharacterized protein LOC135964229 n=1 Tax=Calliphora vicina TaxID=7373 RepID=UPI00325BAC09
MKKVKNTESKENDTSLEIVKVGKVKKNKPKKEKKLKDAVGKMEDINLAPKIESNNLKPTNDGAEKTKKKNKKNKNNPAAKPEQNQESTEGPQKVTDEKPKKQKKSNNKKVQLEKSEPETPAKDVTEPELKKMEKKKAKKLAQKLKKQQKKSENKEEKVTAVAASTNGVKKVKQLKKPATKNVDSKINKVVPTKKLEKPVSKTVDATSSKVLSKKEKKTQKRQLIKEQKLAEKQTRDPAVEAATVFVGNLPINTKRVQLIRLFKDFGPVNSIRLRSAGGQVLHKHKQRRTAGALNAYVVLKNKETAEKALSLNGVEFKDNHLRVTLAVKNPQFHEKEEAKKTVFVGSLKYTATEESLREIFSSCGEIDYVRCIRDGDKGCKGVAYVCFKSPDGVGLALELNGTIVDDRPINVERFSVRKLGAKEAREAQAEKELTSKKGAKQRLDGKKGKKDKSGKDNKSDDADDAKKPKKSEFRGVKVEGLKKKPKSKKKKSNDQMAQLAKKIAPKAKTE